MKTRKYYIATFVLLFTIVTSFETVEDPLFIQNLKNRVLLFNSTFPEEKVYLQFDKPFYQPGDDIWFNAFVLNSNTHQPSTISDVVYVELIDPKGSVMSRCDLVIKEGTANGDFIVSESAPGGLYRIRAFTRWMKNFGDNNYFQKDIHVQRVTTPRLLMRLDFKKESYGPGDEVNATLKITNLKNEKANGAAVRFSVMIAGNKLVNSNIISDGDGEGHITFKLPDTLATTDGLLQTIVLASGIEESISRSIPIVLNKIRIQFFPEGGHWTLNAPSKMAFKAVNEFGKGADVSGYIIDGEGNVVTPFESFHMGMGAFWVTAVPGKKYFAQIDKPAGNNPLMPLPEALDFGFSFGLNETNAKSTVWTIHSPSTTHAHLVGRSHGEIVYASKINLAKGENHIEIPTAHFPAGLAVFTLFDSHDTEQCERLVFLNRDKTLNIELITDKNRYGPREKVDLRIKTRDSKGNATSVKLSLAVVDDKLITFADDKQDNILSSLLLSSEVRGEIQEPSFYFDPEEPKASRALDYLLMTQGWRRFTWKQVLAMDQQILHSAEKIKNLSGTVVHNGQGVASEVTIVELGNKKRIDKIRTTEDGHFIFKNIDPTVAVLLLVKKPGEITVHSEKSFSIVLNDKHKTELLPEQLKLEKSPPTVVESIPVVVNEALLENTDDETNLNMTLQEDVAQLSEVVVTGYGVENKRGLAASLTTVYQKDIAGNLPAATFESLLQGRVAGVIIQPQSGSPGSNVIFRMRGNSSFMDGRGDPLYVIDGFPIGTSLNQNFSNAGIVGPEDVSSVEVMSSPEATALFGSAAANGVILITTKSNLGYTSFKTKQRLAKYNGLTIKPRSFSATRQFYVEESSKTDERENFRATVYWNHTIVTDERGEAKLSFYNNDAVSAFRITAEGANRAGLVGRTEMVYHTSLPLSLDAKLPEFLGFEDTLRLPVQVKNESSITQSAKITITLPPELSTHEPDVRTIQIQPGLSETQFYKITANGKEGMFPIQIHLEAPRHKDKIEQIIQVRPTGFPAMVSFSGNEMDKAVAVSIDEPERGTLKAEFTAFPDVISDLFTGAESILREPHGCFEQVSSSTFPNILALQYLQKSGTISPAIEKKALNYIKSGYKKLMAYEISGGGFEWFGEPAAHEGLTAYGLVEFHEMKKVYAGVDEDMIHRTRRWLLDRRDGKGGFNVRQSEHGFNDVQAISNAYITYALSETGSTAILPEYRRAFEEALQSKDMYRMALVACAAFNLKQMEDYEHLVNIFRKKIETSGFEHLKSQRSIVYSGGLSLLNETTALWTIALLKTPDADRHLVTACIRYILGNRNNGQFGSTQGTTLSLKALTEYANIIRATSDDGEIQISVDNRLAEKVKYEKDAREKIVLNGFTRDLRHNHNQKIRIAFSDTRQPIPYAMNIQWYTKKPQSSTQCKVDLSTQLSNPSVELNETVRLKVVMQNKTSEPLPMTVAVIGIPSGLSPQSWQLKELQEKNVFDFYEILQGNLVLYYRSMESNASKTIYLDLKADIPGTFTGSASSAYLYYHNEFKTWTKGNSIVIN